MIRTLTLILFLLPLAMACQSQPRSDVAVRMASPAMPAADLVNQAVDERFARLMNEARAEKLYEQPMGSIVQEIGMKLVGSSYRAGMLDEPATERLIARLDAFDCVLFVEAALVLAQGAAVEDYSYEGYLRRLENVRYRGGRLDGYASRLHYFTEWISDNDRRGNVVDITSEIGGQPLPKRLDFMSRNRASYARFKTNDAVFAQIREMEANLREHEIFYIPQNQIRRAYPLLEAGDVIALATSIQGLDVTHTGLAFANEDGSFGLLHASLSGEVLVSPDLQTYVENNRVQTGIVVARPVRPSR
jgi:hypothetical protein